ncbi:outer membrane protein assembly factor BamB [Steroidobacter sp. S1-65]|uniref:Outer membrane protein assembly factor BamB n=1 Tax=Steroidobacter gossypii TaxID=2805490 RepID=A0ABS1WUI4_9GAMM|nr:outer membrane protein assembly factor BamB [Steroidobacter gossypii]MBM0104625.1 outer membrane protein assembly factor BamB [Steroidobacter gossypii]
MIDKKTSLTRLYRGARIAAAATALLVMLGCDNDKEVDPPAELTEITTTRDVQRLWTVGLGGDSERLRLALKPNVVDGVVYAASHDGEVVAIAADTGKRQWIAKTKLALSAGPEVGGGLVVLGSSDGDIIALDATNGAQRWRQSIASEILARPLIVNDTVVIRTVDGHIEALSAVDGATKWAVDESVPRLTLRGTAPPVLAGDRIIAGFDSGKVLAIDPRNGDVLWDTIVNAPRGRTELERLTDIDAPARVSGDDIFVVGFQGRVAMLARDSGQIWWARDASSYRGFAMDEQNLYLTNADSVVIAMRRSDGAVQWEQDTMKRRGLTAPAIDGDALVVGDFEGYLHWLDKATGEIVARQKTDGERITNAAVSDDQRVYVQTDSGKLLVFRSAAREVKTADSGQ